MYMDEPPLQGSDPETSIAVPEQFIRIDIAVRSSRFGWIAPRIGYDSTLSPASCMSPAPCMAINSRPSSALLRPIELRRRRISPWRTGLQSPKPGLCSRPRDCLSCPHTNPKRMCRRRHPRPSTARCRFGLRTAGLWRVRQRAGPHCSLTVLEQRCHKFPRSSGSGGQLAAIPGREAGKCANPKSAVARDEQAVDVVAGRC